MQKLNSSAYRIAYQDTNITDFTNINNTGGANSDIAFLVDHTFLVPTGQSGTTAEARLVKTHGIAKKADGLDGIWRMTKQYERH